MRGRTSAIAITWVLAWATTAEAWQFTEHQALARRALHRLEPANLDRLASMWRDWRVADNRRELCDVGVETDRADRERCIDLAMLSALAGDHACTPDELVASLSRDWLRKTVERLSEPFTSDKDPREEQLARDAHIQALDPRYVERSASGSHFARDRQTNDWDLYWTRSVREGAPANVIGTFAVYHRVALAAAAAYAKAVKADAPLHIRGSLARRTLLAEAFALHMLEDAFSSGHVVGRPTDAYLAKGTHDWYSAHGVSARTWAGNEYIAHGDGFLRAFEGGGDGVAAPLRDRDAEHAGLALRMALHQLACVATPADRRESGQDCPPFGALYPDRSAALASLAFDTCRTPQMPADAALAAGDNAIAAVARHTLVPAYGPGHPSVPLIRTELGPFGRLFAGGRFALAVSDQVGVDEDRPFGGQTALELGAGLGYSGQGLVDRTRDAAWWIQLTLATASGHRDYDSGWFDLGAPRSASRFQFGARVRIPWTYLPFDTLIVPPVLVGVGWQVDAVSYLEKASAGGWWRFQRIRPLSARWSWQIIALREIAIEYANDVETFGVLPGEVDLWMFEFPLVEFRYQHRGRSSPFKTAMTFQLYGGFEIPTEVDGARGLEPDASWSGGIRAGFDARLFGGGP